MWPVFVVMAPVDAEHVFEVSATDDEDPVKAVGSDGAHPALSVSVRVRRLYRRADHRSTLRTDVAEAHIPTALSSPAIRL